MIGRTLGHYEIVDHLGAGGMGEVYRARDTHLDRDVAIKVLPEGLDSAPDRLARFEREAKLLAQLDHPNIATVYDLEESDGIRFIAMEAVEGETLAEHLERGPLPVELALGIASHIAEALEAAHDKGIIHRDLKPANVMLTPDVKVKVLDFGLAKAFEAEAPIANLSHSPTMAAATQAGVILGTAAYMSPEQARGRPLDRRTDIWSFGCVLFEMLTGRKPFAGADVSDMIATILRDEPDWNLLPATTPPMARALLHRCLRRDPDLRLHDIADARIEIGDALGVSGEVMASLPGTVVLPEPRPLWQRTLPWGLVAVMAAVTGLAIWNAGGPAQPGPVRPTQFEIKLSDAPLLVTEGAGFVLSPDGSRVAYAVGGDASTEGLYVRSLDQLEGVRLIEGFAGSPFFSPDGQWVGYTAEDDTLWKVPVTGGSPIRLALGESAAHPSATWGPDDTIVYTSRPDRVLFRVSATGGEPDQLTELAQGERSHLGPAVLPGGRGVVFTSFARRDGVDETAVEVLDLQTRRRQVIHRGGAHGRYVASGHITYVDGDTLFALPFDPDRLEMAGPPVGVLQGVGSYMGLDESQLGAPYSVAADGTLLYLRDTGRPVTLLRIHRDGAARPVWPTGVLAYWPVLSPDGTRVALALHDDEYDTSDVYVFDLERGVPTQVTFDPGIDVPNGWFPDGRELVISSDRGAPGDPLRLYRKRADGTGSVEWLNPSDSGDAGGASVSADGRLMAYHKWGDIWDIWIQRLDGESEPKLVAGGARSQVYAQFSPDGHWIAYGSGPAGQQEVYVQPYPLGAGGKLRISSAGGEQPQWSGDGRELYYRTNRGVMVVDVETEHREFRAGTPRLLFEMRSAGDVAGIRVRSYFLPDFDAAPDGQSFFLLDEPILQHVTLRLDWLEELKQRVPAGR